MPRGGVYQFLGLGTPRNSRVLVYLTPAQIEILLESEIADEVKAYLATCLDRHRSANKYRLRQRFQPLAD